MFEAALHVRRILEINPKERFVSGIWTTSERPEYKCKWTEALASLDKLRPPE